MAAKRNVKYTPLELKRRSELAKKQSKQRSRDAHGHFISLTSKTPSDKANQKSAANFKIIFVLGFALLCLLLAFFQLGRLEILGRDSLTTRLGIMRIASQTNPPKYLLIEKSGRVLTLMIPQGVDVALYQNRRVLVTGYFSDLAGTLRLTSRNDIEPAPAVVQSAL